MHVFISGMLATPHPALPRGKTGCPAPRKAGHAPPRKIYEIRGVQRGKTDSIDTPFYYARD